MIECSCSKTEYEHIWNTQLYYNIPLLLLFTNMIHNFCIDKGIQEIIFINRNCTLIKQIFDIVNKVKPINVTITELTISIKLLQNKRYLQKVIKQFNKTTKYLIVDINTGVKKIMSNIFKASYNIEPYFYFIFSNIDTKDLYTYSLFNEDNELSKIIELLNLPEIGLPNDYVHNIIKYDPIDYDVNIPLIYYEVIEIINNMPDLLFINDLHQNFLDDFLINLNQLKINIINNSEYKMLYNIYKNSTTKFLKLDYTLASPVVISNNTEIQPQKSIPKVINSLNPALINIIKSSSRKSSNKSIKSYIGTNSLKNTNSETNQETNSELSITTNNINNNVVDILNEPKNQKINGIDLFETTTIKNNETKVDDIELNQFEPNLNKRISNLRKLSAKSEKK
jgi:hypothetical protein